MEICRAPCHPSRQVCDIQAISPVAHAAGALVCVDNSIMAPVFQQPLALGADICMTSATKFIGGHSDITAGTLSVRGADIAQRIYFHQVHAAPRQNAGRVALSGAGLPCAARDLRCHGWVS